MSLQLLIFTSETVLTLLTGIGILLISLATIYDFRVITRRRYIRAAVTKLRRPRQPQVTVLVYAKNNASTLVACLQSIERSRYRRYNVVVVDNKSSDQTSQIARQYHRDHPRSPYYFYQKRKASDQVTALRQAAKKVNKADMVLVVSAASVVSPTLLKASVARLMDTHRFAALRLTEYYVDSLSFMSLLPNFLQLSKRMYAKGASLFALESVQLGSLNTLYQAAIFQKSRATRITCAYANDLAVSTKQVTTTRPVSSSWNLQVLSFVALVVGIYLMTYFMYTAATLQSSSLLLLSWLIVSLWFLVTVWSDEAATFIEKMTRTFCIPILYFLVYIWAIMRSVKLLIGAGRLVTVGWLAITEPPHLLAE